MQTVWGLSVIENSQSIKGIKSTQGSRLKIMGSRKAYVPRKWGRYGRGIKKEQIVRSAPTAQNQKNQILALADRVGSLQSAVRIGRQISQYQTTYNANLSADVNSFDMVVPASWTNVFADPPAMEDANRVSLKHMKLDMLFTTGSEPAPITYSVFLVTLKSETADQLMSIAGSGLTGLLSGAHYAKSGVYGGLVHLNEQFFSVKKAWRFSTTEQMVGSKDPGKQQSQTYKRFTYSCAFPRRLWSGRNQWRTALTSDRVASQAKMYLLIFNDNSQIDLQYPDVDVNVIFKVEGY